MLSKSSLSVWFDNLKENNAPKRKRKLLYDGDGHKRTKPKFKKASPEKMESLKLKLEKEKQLNDIKKVILVLILFVIGIFAVYYIIYG